MSLYVVRAGDQVLPVGGPVDGELFARWLGEQVTASHQEHQRLTAQGVAFDAEARVRALAWWHGVFHVQRQWAEARQKIRAHAAGEHLRNFEITLCGKVLGDAGALRYHGELVAGGRRDTDHSGVRLAVNHEWACRVLGEYAGADWRAVQDCGEDQNRLVGLVSR